MSSNPTGLSSATTYQAIVIALVAAGIISIGVMSVCYRRRRRDEWERTVRAGIERTRFRHGFGEMGGLGADGDDIGEKPILWDVDIGGQGEEWVPIRIGMDGQDKKSSPPSTLGSGNTTTSKQPHDRATQVEMTILIAMPHPPYPSSTSVSASTDPNPDPPSNFTSINLNNPTEEVFTLSDLPHYRHTPTNQEIEDEEIPYLELGTTSVPLVIGSVEEEKEVEDLRLGSIASRAGIAGDWARGRSS